MTERFTHIKLLPLLNMVNKKKEDYGLAYCPDCSRNKVITIKKNKKLFGFIPITKKVQELQKGENTQHTISDNVVYCNKCGKANHLKF